ncbi:MAG: ABC transporter ATP-binding protein [Holosporales bacterium]|jgi:ABC-2 type transport system ATP-binding protein|nr:ABC transporter ATP-binding protein [Holosporales bacterium]
MNFLSKEIKGMDNFVVIVNHLYVKFGNFYAVSDVSFSVRCGEIFGFLGANGAGKTTTIRVLCGLIVPTSGEVIIDSEYFIKGKENRIKQKVGYMSQKFTLYDDLSIEENLDFTAALRQIPADVYSARKKQLFEFIGFNKSSDIIIADLPGGQKQEIALIASILHDPQIVFLDEPTAGVAPASRMRFWDLVKKLSQTGKTIFVTTHYMDEAEHCNRIALMRTGELIALDTPENLKKNTYQKQIYLLTPKDKNCQGVLINRAQEYFSMFEPYGRHFHAIVRDDITEEKVVGIVTDICFVKKIEPSLEDVFVKLVEEGITQ